MKYSHACIRLIVLLCFSLPFFLQAQVGINADNSDPDPSAMLDISSTEKGMLIPRLTTIQREQISDPVVGLMIYNLDDSCFNYFSGESWIKNCGSEGVSLPFDQLSGGASGNSAGYDLAIDSAGYMYAIGRFQGTMSLGDTTLDSNFSGDIFITKIAPSGRMVWAKNMGGQASGLDLSIAIGPNGNIYASGDFSNNATFGDTILTSNGQSDIFVSKLDPNGNFLWVSRVGASESEYVMGISVDAAGNSYIACRFSGTTSIGSHTFTSNGNLFDSYLAKLDPNGQILWAEHFGNGQGLEHVRDIALDGLGNIYVTGFWHFVVSIGDSSFIGPWAEENIFVAKFDTDGQFIWAVEAGGSENDSGEGISTDAAGNCYVTGHYGSSATFGDTTLTGSARVLYVAKYNASGQFVWIAQAEGATQSFGRSISTDVAGNSYIAGYFAGTPSFGAFPLSTTGSFSFTDAIVAKVDPTGEFEWAYQAGGSDRDRGYGISFDAAGKAYSTGFFTGTGTFGNAILTATGFNDFFLWGVNGADGPNATYTGGGLADLEDGDTDPMNELQTLSLTGTGLTISGGNTVDLSGLNTDAQTLSLSGNTLSLSNGGSINLSSFLDNTDSQTLGLSGNMLSLSNGGSINLSSFLDNTDSQILGLSGNTLSLSNGGSVDLGSYLDNTDAQTLSRSGNILSLSNGGSVNLSFFLDNTDTQTLTLSGTNLTISGGNTANLSSLQDDLGDHTATQNLELDGNWLSNDGGNEGIFVNTDGKVGIGTSTLQSLLHIKNGTEGDDSGIRLSAGSVNSVIYHDNGDLILRKLAIPNQLVLDATGNIGMGMNTPTNPLHMASGAFVTSSGVWTNASDSARKYDIRDLVYGLEEVLQMRPVAYSYKSDSSASIGFIAQELENFIPEVVSGEEGNKGVAYGLITSILVNAMQEQQEKIASLEKENAQLRAEVKSLNSLEARLQALEAALNHTK